MDYATMKVSEVAALPGVSDLPLRVRGPFAQALIAEARGEHTNAANKLDQAVQAESKS